MLILRIVCCVLAAGAANMSYAQRAGVGVVEVTDKLISVSGSGHKRAFPCQGRKLEVLGSDHMIVTSGVCSEVDVSGSKNTVEAEIDPKGRLEVAGSGHTVRWKSSGQPAQDVSGADHKVSRMK